MFKATIPNAKYLLDLIKAINIVAEEGCFKVSPDAITLNAIDPAHIALVDFKLMSGVAEEWVLDGHDQLKMEVSVSEMLRILGRIKSGEVITIAYNPEEKRVRFVLDDAVGSRRRTIYLNTLEELEHKDFKPKVDFQARATLATSGLREAVEDCRLISDILKLTIGSEAVEVSAKGERGKALVRLPKYGGLIHEIEADQEISSYYSIGFLAKMLKAGMLLNESVAVELATDKPLRLGFEIPCGRLEYYLAPNYRS